jgi:large conductance mechanosensitive channel
MSIVKEFQDFIARGNALDMAVGIIMGGAFNKIVNSIVTDLVMPPIGYFSQGVPFNEMGWELQKKVVDQAGTVTQPQILIKFGAFASTVIEFFIVALTVFLVIKFVNQMSAYREALTPAFLRGEEEAAEKDKKDPPPAS